MKKYDTVVIGGGLAGTSAAISAARLGCKVALVQDRPVLGGNSSSEIRVVPTGAHCSGLRRELRETGIIEEMLLESWYRDPLRSFWVWDTILWEWVRREKNLTLYLNSSAREVVMANKKRIKGIICEQLSTEKKFYLAANIFIDASGDGAIAYQAGAKFRMGREGKKEFNESLAPDKADNKTLGSSLMFVARDMKRPVKFTPPDWARKFPQEKDLPFRIHTDIHYGYWWIAYGGVKDTIKDNEQIRDELLKILFGVWDHIKNYGYHRAENFALDWIGFVPGKRESRRFIGDYILRQKDVEKSTLFDDRVAYGGWGIDLHPPEGIYCRRQPYGPVRELKSPYSIPFRCLYSKNIENLMFAGRNISTTHVAFGSTRVMGTCSIEGQATGTAAFLCKKYKITPKLVYKKHIRELQQQLLKDDCYIINLKNEDTEDLARAARVKSSSSRKLEVTTISGVTPSDRPLAQLFPLTSNFINHISLHLRSSLKKPIFLSLYLRKAEHLFDFTSNKNLFVTSATVPPGNSWVDFPIKQKFSRGLYWLYLPKKTGIGWSFSKKEIPGLNSAAFGAKLKRWQLRWQLGRADYCFKIDPLQRPFSPENVINGTTRAERWDNIWISEKGFPQYLELEFKRKIRLNTIYLTFNTNLSNYLSLDYLEGMNKSLKNRLPPSGKLPETVKDYALYYWKKSWIKFIKVEGNYQRHRKHQFKPITTSRLRLKISATHGSPETMVYEMRVY